MKFRFVILVLFFTHLLCGQKPYTGSLDDLYLDNKLSETELKYNQSSARIVFYQRPGVNEVTLIFDTDETNKHTFQFDEGNTDTVLPGNTLFDGELGYTQIDTASCTSFYYHHKLYYSVPLLNPHCNGSFCRWFQCLLIAVNQKKVFYFADMDIMGWFCIDKEDHLVYMDMNNGDTAMGKEDVDKWLQMDSDINRKLASDTSLMKQKQVADTDDETYQLQPYDYKILPLYLDENTFTWKPVMNNYGIKYILVEAPNEYEMSPYQKNKIIISNW